MMDENEYFVNLNGFYVKYTFQREAYFSNVFVIKQVESDPDKS